MDEFNETQVALDALTGLMTKNASPDEMLTNGVAYLRKITMDQLDEDSLFGGDFIVPGGPMRSCISRWNGKNYWLEVGSDEEYNSVEFRRALEQVWANPFIYQICLHDDVFAAVVEVADEEDEW